MDNMVKISKLDGLKRSIAITVPKEQYAIVFDSNIIKYKNKTKLDGFRAGKVPEKVILQKFTDQIHNDTLNKIMEDALYKALVDNKIDTASPPQIKIDEIPSREKDLKFTAEFEIYPLFQITDLSSLSIEEPDVEITKNDIDEVILNIQKQHIIWKETKEIAKSNNKIVIDYKALSNGETFDNNEQKDFSFVIDEKVKGDEATVKLYAEFFRHTKGLSIGQSTKFSFKMPSSFPEKSIAGKDIDYDLTVKKVFDGELPVLNKDFFKKFGIEDGTDDVFKKNISEHMSMELTKKKKTIQVSEINKNLVEKNIFDVPLHMIESERKSLEQQYQSMMNNLDETTKIELENIATKRAKLNIIYTKLTEDNKIKIEDNDVFSYISTTDEATKKHLLGKIKEDKKHMNQIKNKLLEDAIIELVLSKCKIIKVKKSFSEVVN